MLARSHALLAINAHALAHAQKESTEKSDCEYLRRRDHVRLRESFSLKKSMTKSRTGS